MLEINWLKIGLLVFFYAGIRLFVRSDNLYKIFLGYAVSLMALLLLLEGFYDLQ